MGDSLYQTIVKRRFYCFQFNYLRIPLITQYSFLLLFSCFIALSCKIQKTNILMWELTIKYTYCLPQPIHARTHIHTHPPHLPPPPSPPPTHKHTYTHFYKPNISLTFSFKENSRKFRYPLNTFVRSGHKILIYRLSAIETEQI